MHQTVEGDNAVGVQIDGDGNCVTIFSGGSRLLLDQPHRRRGASAPANERQLLLTEWRATGLVGRDAELSDLRDWRDSAAQVSIRCITGRAGAGKTRLAIEGCEQAEADGWLAGFASGDELRRFHAAQNLAQWRPPGDTLVVVDEASVSGAILKDWFGAIARRQPKPNDRKLRVLLLDRHAEAESEYGWWAELKRVDSFAWAGAGDLISEPPVPLPSLNQPEARRALFAEAMRLAARFLDKTPLVPPPAGADAEFDRRLADDRLENEPLFLMMAGIIGAERGAPAALALGRLDLASQMAALERARLARFGASQGLPSDGEVIAHLAACATLQRGCDLAAAKKMVAEELAAMDFRTPLSADRLVDLLAETLPAGGSGEIDRVRPDLIGEAFLVREISGPRARSTDEHWAIVRRAFRRQEANVLETLVLAAQDLAAGSGDHPAVRWLSKLAAEATDHDELTRIGDAIPSTALALREVAAQISERIVRLLRQDQDGDQTDALSVALNDLGVRLSRLGQREAALAALQESIHLRLGRSADGSSMERLDLGSALSNLASMLSDLGDHDAALEAAREAVELQRPLAGEHPEFVPHLARSLNNLGKILTDLGQGEMALEAALESLGLRRTLADARPDLFKADLAHSLNNLVPILMAIGQRQMAHAGAQESVELFRSLAAGRPDAFNADLAGALHNLGAVLGQLNQYSLAVAAAQEAADLYRDLAAARPDAFNYAFAASLSNLAGFMGFVGDAEAALGPAQEAVDLYRTLADTQPVAFNPNLAASLNNLSSSLSTLGRHEAALAAVQEAVDLRRMLAAARPEAFTHNLAISLHNLAGCLSELGRRKEAIAAAEETVALRRIVAAGRPEATNPDLANSLGMLADLLQSDGRLVEAVALDREAVAALAPSFLALPAAFFGPMVSSIRYYLRRSELAGVEPDGELLLPIFAVIEKLQEGRSDVG